MKSFPKKKKFFHKKVLVAVLLVFMLSFSPVAIPKAHAWDAVIGETFGNLMQMMLDQIQGIILGMLKSAATSAINQMTIKMTAGGNNGPMFIVNWQDYLVAQPQQRTQARMNDYLTQVTRMRGSSSFYIPAAGLQEGIGNNAFNMGLGQYGNYSSRLLAQAQNNVINSVEPQMTYAGNPAQMFAKGNFKDMGNYISGINSLWSFDLNNRYKEQQILAQEQKIASDKAIANNAFLGKEKDGQTVTPAAVVKENLTNVQNMGNEIIVNADSIGSVITGLVSKMVTQTITQGIGNIQVKIQKEVTGVQQRAQTQVRAKINANGPGALYNR